MTEERRIVVEVSAADNDSQQCSINVAVSLTNDNPPVVDLSGPLQPSLNHSVSLEYNFTNQASVWIAARDASITDLDANSHVVEVNVSLQPGFPGDGIYLSEVVGCPIDSSDICHIR